MLIDDRVRIHSILDWGLTFYGYGGLLCGVKIILLAILHLHVPVKLLE